VCVVFVFFVGLFFWGCFCNLCICAYVVRNIAGITD
jgi:hypothetical protein